MIRTYKVRSVTHASQHGPPNVSRRASEKDSLLLPTWMSPQRRRRFRKLSSRIRKSFRAAKRWKSSFRVRRRSSTFRVSNMCPIFRFHDGVSVESLLFCVLELLAKRSRLVCLNMAPCWSLFKAIVFCCLFWIQECLYTWKMSLLAVEANFGNNNMQTWILKL